RMDLGAFFLYTLLGSLIWNGALVGVGALLGASWPLVSERLGYYSSAAKVIGPLALVALAVWIFRPRRGRRELRSTRSASATPGLSRGTMIVTPSWETPMGIGRSPGGTGA